MTVGYCQHVKREIQSVVASDGRGKLGNRPDSWQSEGSREEEKESMERLEYSLEATPRHY